MATIASLNVLLTATTGPLQKKLTEASTMVGGFATKFAGFGTVIGSGVNAALGEMAVIVAAIGGVVGSLHKAEEASVSIRRLDAILAATGNTTGIARGELLELSEAMEKTTNFSHIAAEGATALLASFHNISGDSFKSALSAAADLSSVMGTDLPESAKLIGRALENPAQGMARLNRLGIGFTAIQEQQIKTMQTAGNIAGAQAQILAGIQGKFGGAAAAMASPFVQLKNAIFNVGESIGGLLLPFVEQALKFITPIISTIANGIKSVEPIVARVANVMRTFFGAVVDFALTKVAPVWSWFTNFLGTSLSGALGIWVDWLPVAFNYFSQAVDTAIAAGAALGEALGDVFSTIADLIGVKMNASSISLGGFVDVLKSAQEYITATMTVLEFGFSHWKDLAAYALVSAEYGVVKFANQLEDYFTVAVPAALVWMGGVFVDVFVGILKFQGVVFGNMLTNTFAVWDGIKGIFKGHGTGDFQFKSLTDGFTFALRELPQIAKRQIGPLESHLGSELDSLSGQLGKSFNTFIDTKASAAAKSMADLHGKLTKAALPAVQLKVAPMAMAANQLGGVVEQSKVGALVRGSAEEYRARNESEAQARQAALAQQQLGVLNKINNGINKLVGNTDGLDDPEPAMSF